MEKVCILIDRERIVSVLGLWSYCTFKFEDDIRWIFGHANAYKFLVVNGTMIIGAVEGHAELYALWALRDKPFSDDISERAKAIAAEQYGRPRYQHGVTAAGIVSADGQVTNWKSLTYKVETPEVMRDALGQEIKRLFTSGALISW